MAQGRAGATGWLVAIAITLTVLVSTGVWNPFPGIWNWINTSGPLADPPTQWQERLGGVPQTVTVVDKYVVIEQRDKVEVRSRSTGRQLWSTPADWAAVAGPPGRTVVVAGKLLVKGYQVIDPATGAVIRRDERASAVWSYADALLDVACRSPQDCELTAREPASGDEIWRVDLPGIGFVLFADNPALMGSTPIGSERIAVRADPAPMPPMLGFPIDGRAYVVDTSAGKALPALEPDRHERIIVVAGRVLHSVATSRDGSCTTTLTAQDAISGDQVWQRNGYQLRTISGSACEQRQQPAGWGNAIVAVHPDGREVLLDAADGREVLICAAGERILATDGVKAIVRAADGAKITAYALGKTKALWSRKVSAEASAALTRTTVVLVDRGPDRIIVLDPDTGKVRREARTDADVLAADENGLLLGDRRELGYLAFG